MHGLQKKNNQTPIRNHFRPHSGFGPEWKKSALFLLLPVQIETPDWPLQGGWKPVSDCLKDITQLYQS